MDYGSLHCDMMLRSVIESVSRFLMAHQHN